MKSCGDVEHVGWSPRRRTCLAAAVVSAFFAALLIGPGRAAAEASIAVEIEAVPPVRWLDDADWLITVSNPGTEPLTSVVVDLSASGSLFDPTTFTGPVVAVGNADDVLDPGERWSYGASGIEHVSSLDVVTVSAVAPDTTPVTASAGRLPQPLEPVEFTFTPDKNAVVAGETVTWDISARNLTSANLLVPSALESRILFPDWQGPIPRELVSEPVQKGADGDDTFGPGETWVWRYSAVLTNDGSFLDVVMLVIRQDVPSATWGPNAESGPISVAAAPATTVAPATTTAPMPPPTGALPGTGADERLALIALLTLVLGSTLLLVSHRRLCQHR